MRIFVLILLAVAVVASFAAGASGKTEKKYKNVAAYFAQTVFCFFVLLVCNFGLFALIGIGSIGEVFTPGDSLFTVEDQF